MQFAPVLSASLTVILAVMSGTQEDAQRARGAQRSRPQRASEGPFYISASPHLDHLRLGAGVFIRDLTKPAHTCLDAPEDDTIKSAVRTSYDESFVFTAEQLRSFLGIELQASVPIGAVPVSGSLQSRFERLFESTALHFVMNARAEFEPERLMQVKAVKNLQITQGLCGDYVVVGVRRATYVAAILTASGVSEQVTQELRASMTVGAPATANLTVKVTQELKNAYQDRRFELRIISSGGSGLKTIVPDLGVLNLADPKEFVTTLFNKVRNSLKDYVDKSADSRPAAVGFYLMPLDRFLTTIGESPIFNDLKMRRLEAIGLSFTRFQDIQEVYERRAPEDLAVTCPDTLAEMCQRDPAVIDSHLVILAQKHRDCLASLQQPNQDPACDLPALSDRIATIDRIFKPVALRLNVRPIQQCKPAPALAPATALTYVQQIAASIPLANRDAILLEQMRLFTNSQVTQAELELIVSGPNIRVVQFAVVDDDATGAPPRPLQSFPISAGQPQPFNVERTKPLTSCGQPLDDPGMLSRFLQDTQGITRGRIVVRAVDSTSFQSTADVLRFQRDGAGAVRVEYVPYVLTFVKETRR